MQTLMKVGMISALTLVLAPSLAPAHGPVERKAEVANTALRLFTADAANGEVVVIDMPSGDVVARLSTPPYIMSLGFSHDYEHLFAMRGRSTDRDMVTVISTGYFSDSDIRRPPYVARTLPAETPGGIREDHLATVGGKDAVFMESSAEIVVFENEDFTGLEEISVRRYALAGNDHYHYLEAGDFLYVGHLALGMLQILNRETGEEVKRLERCPVLHGMIKDEDSGRLFFACARDVMVVGTRGEELNQDLLRIPYPDRQRIGAFLRGPQGIYWGFTEGTIPQLHRLNVAEQPYAFTSLPVESSVRQAVSPDGQYLLSLSRAGNLDIRSGETGELYDTVAVARAFDKDFHEHVDKAVLPDIVVADGHAFVSLPHQGKIVEVDLETAEIKGELDIGGEPTRLLALKMSVGS